LQIKGKLLHADFREIDSRQSSQYVSAVAMILPLINREASICFSDNNASLQYIDMTLGIMQHLGLNIRRKNNRITYFPFEKTVKPFSVTVEQDWSAAAVWFVTAAMADEADIFINELQESVLQADSIIVKWIELFGVKTEFLTNGVRITKTQHKQPKKLILDCANNPDLVPYLAVLCVGLKIAGELRNVENLALKESNRIEALQTELGKIATINYLNNHLVICPKAEQFPATIRFSAHEDHRMAMSLSALACRIDTVYIDDEECVSKSYPDFWKQFLFNEK
jgi:3-phosphoshikimate 1-carboxyvinyltransferase